MLDIRDLFAVRAPAELLVWPLLTGLDKDLKAKVLLPVFSVALVPFSTSPRSDHNLVINHSNSFFVFFRFFFDRFCFSVSKDHFQFISIFGFFFVKKSLINKISFLIFVLFRKWKICVLVLRESVNHFLRFSCCLEMEILPPPERVVGYGGVYYTRNIHFH